MNKSLITLNLDFNPNIGSDGIAGLCKGLSSNTTLKILSLKYCDIDQDGSLPLKEMLSFPKLAIHTLNLAGNRITGIGLGMLSIGIGKNQVLQNVDISDNQIVSESEVDVQNLDTFAMALTDHKSLKSVNLRDNFIDIKGGTVLLKGIKDNKTISSFFVDTTSLPEELYAELCRIPSGKEKKKKGGGKKKKKK